MQEESSRDEKEVRDEETNRKSPEGHAAMVTDASDEQRGTGDDGLKSTMGARRSHRIEGMPARSQCGAVVRALHSDCSDKMYRHPEDMWNQVFGRQKVKASRR